MRDSRRASVVMRRRLAGSRVRPLAASKLQVFPELSIRVVAMADARHHDLDLELGSEAFKKLARPLKPS